MGDGEEGLVCGDRHVKCMLSVHAMKNVKWDLFISLPLLQYVRGAGIRK